MSTAKTNTNLDTARAKYRAERDKRIREDGNNQYVSVDGVFSDYVDDPYVEPKPRKAITRDTEIAIVGGGFGGLLAGARLRQAGFEDLTVIEKAGDFGGTWYWNRYPGAQCDIESYIYLPLLEELGYIPKEKYSYAPEILKHSRAIGKHFRLYDNALFQTCVTEMRWDEERLRWIIATDRGDTIAARYVCMSNGPLNRPKLPGIDGIESYAGHSFHTSRWDYDYTGGDPDGNLDKLGDKVVGIIGTGATAVQCVPHLAQAAKYLYVFQRTPSSIDVRGNSPTDPEWSSSLQPGWQKLRMKNFNILVSGGYQEDDLVNDGWTDIIRNLGISAAARAGDEGGMSLMEMAERIEEADLTKMNQIRERVQQLVEDPKTAEALMPWYRQFCKRPCFHDDYLPSFNRPNVDLVDTDGKGVQRITPAGVVANGQEYKLDCLIYATGFEVGTAYTRRSGYEVRGRGGKSLSEKWESGPQTLHGLQSHEFPNCFFMGVIQGAFTANFPHMLEEQANHIAYILKTAADKQCQRVEVTRKAEQDWAAAMDAVAVFNERFLKECTPGYYNNEGQPGKQNSLAGASYGAGPEAFFDLLEHWRNEGSLEGVTLK